MGQDKEECCKRRVTLAGTVLQGTLVRQQILRSRKRRPFFYISSLDLPPLFSLPILYTGYQVLQRLLLRKSVEDDHIL